MEKISIFANFSIDSAERFLRLKDSFFSFYKADIFCWRINIRGEYKLKVEKFLRKNVKQDLKIFFLDTDRGWLEDSKEVIRDINSSLIFAWVEDHICIKDQNTFNEIVSEMYKEKVDNLIYTWFHQGKYKIPIKHVEHLKCENITIFDYNKVNYNIIEKVDNSLYPIVLTCIMSLSFFKKNLDLSKKKLKYNIKLPFNFEKNFHEAKNLIFRNAILNNELFVSIDDDLGCENSSLINRNMYPNRVSRDDLLKLRNSKQNIFYEVSFVKKIIKKFFTIFKR